MYVYGHMCHKYEKWQRDLKSIIFALEREFMVAYIIYEIWCEFSDLIKMLFFFALFLLFLIKACHNTIYKKKREIYEMWEDVWTYF